MQERNDPWSPGFTPPTGLVAARFHLVPITGEHAVSDYTAIMDSYEHLKSTMRFGLYFQDAPYTIPQNREALDGHRDEFVHRQAYAYTVLAPDDHEKCIGCTYINPPGEQAARQPAAELTYWVTRQSLKLDFDRALLGTLLEWIEEEWPYEAVVLPYHEANVRGMDHARELGIGRRESPDLQGRTVFEWVRD